MEGESEISLPSQFFKNELSYIIMLPCSLLYTTVFICYVQDRDLKILNNHVTPSYLISCEGQVPELNTGMIKSQVKVYFILCMKVVGKQY